MIFCSRTRDMNSRTIFLLDVRSASQSIDAWLCFKLKKMACIFSKHTPAPPKTIWCLAVYGRCLSLARQGQFLHLSGSMFCQVFVCVVCFLVWLFWFEVDLWATRFKFGLISCHAFLCFLFFKFGSESGRVCVYLGRLGPKLASSLDRFGVARAVAKDHQW